VAWVNLDSQVLFAVPSSNGLFTELGNESLQSVAHAGGFLRHEAFDWAAGDAGAKCVLLEWRGLPESPVAAQAPLDAGTVLPDVLLFGAAQWQGVRWLAFPLAARALADGSDRRFLQLAVQYVSSGGVVEDNVVAADADAGFLGQLGKALEDKK
jgi:hypothetical protein